jgi:hypothetical protein
LKHVEVELVFEIIDCPSPQLTLAELLVLGGVLLVGLLDLGGLSLLGEAFLGAAGESEGDEDDGVALDVVRERPVVLQLVEGEDEALLVLGDALLAPGSSP